MEELISIVVPVYNAEKYLERTIKSIQNQTLSGWELLLIDDCSTDGSRDVMKKYECANIRCFYCEKNAGPANARNVGLENAKGRYLAFIDSDDLWEPDKLEKQMAFMKENGYAFTFTSYEFANENAERNGCIAHAPKRVDYKDILRSSTIAPSTSILDREQIADELIKMPLHVDREDAATWMQILKQGHVAYGLDEVLMIYCRHAGAYSGNKWKAVLGKWQLYHEVEGFSVIKSLYYVFVNTWAAVRRRL